MKYTMKAIIESPEGKEITQNLVAVFFFDENTYGNKHWLSIHNEASFEQHYDIRYDSEFNPEQKMVYLVRWASNFWSGKDGAYSLKEITIKKEE